jgi:hypothetical protein
MSRFGLGKVTGLVVKVSLVGRPREFTWTPDKVICPILFRRAVVHEFAFRFVALSMLHADAEPTVLREYGVLEARLVYLHRTVAFTDLFDHFLRYSLALFGIGVEL